MRDPTIVAPDRVLYYQGDAKPIASCMMAQKVVTDQCDDPVLALTVTTAEGGRTLVLRCMVLGSGGAGAAAAGAGLAGFAAGQAFDAAMSGPSAGVSGYTHFTAALRDVAPATVEARLWLTPFPMRGEALSQGVLAGLDSCAGQRRLASPPTSISSGGMLRP